MNILHSTPILEARTSKDNAKFWQGFAAELDNGDCVTYREYWQVNSDGVQSKVQTSAHTVVKGKNIGRANETTPRDQAIFEIRSDEKIQRDKGYGEVGAVASGPVLPMLAHKFNEKLGSVSYPVYAQPKYDGNRALTDGKSMWSRKGLPFLPEVVAHLMGGSRPVIFPDSLVMKKGETIEQVVARTKYLTEYAKTVNHSVLFQGVDYTEIFPALDTEGYTLDGEIIMPHGTALQDTNAALRKYRAETHNLIYRVYDIVAPALEYKERYAIAARIVRNANNPNVVLAPVELANNYEELMAIHERYTSEGWEGTMVRLQGHGYAVGHRNVQLLKLKDFLDAEFRITGMVEGQGKLAGCAIFVAETSDGKSFQVSPVGSLEQRAHWFEHPLEVIGTVWTLRYQALTKDGIPQFARAMNERDVALSGD